MDIKQPAFNASNLYETRTFTDITLGSITQHIPVISSAVGMPTRDIVREEMFIGSTVLHTTGGPMNISFPIPGTNLGEAVANYDQALKNTLDEMKTRALRNKIITGGGLLNNKKPTN